MLTTDSQINALVLKWANNIFGTWGEVTKDLVEFKKQVEEELIRKQKEDEKNAA